MQRRLGWGLADQTLSSLTNFSLGLFAARNLGVRGLGAFGLAFGTYAFSLSISNALNTDPLMVRFSVVDQQRWRAGVRKATGGAISLGVLTGVLCLMAGIATDGVMQDAFVPLGVAMPGLLLQDSWRYAFFAAGRGLEGFITDLVWALAMAIVILLFTAASESMSVTTLMVAWGSGATIASLGGVVQARLIPVPAKALLWWREHRDIGPRYILEYAARAAARHGPAFVVASVAGLFSAGAWRAAQLLLSPLNPLFLGVDLIAIPEAVRLMPSPARLQRMVRTISGGLALLAMLWGIGVFLVPRSIGTTILHSAWDASHALVLPVAVGMAGLGAASGAVVGLRALAAARRTLHVRAVTAATTLVSATLGAAFFGVVGVAIATAIAAWFGAFLASRELGEALREQSQLSR